MKSAFQDLLAWQKGMDLVDEIYDIVLEFPRYELFGLSSQMRRAAARIPSDIAEGSGHGSPRDFRRFLRDARGSAYELETQIIIARRRRYISDERAGQLTARCIRTAQLINGLIRHVTRKLRLGERQTVNGQPRRSKP
jgi:four helix bundle protein